MVLRLPHIIIGIVNFDIGELLFTWVNNTNSRYSVLHSDRLIPLRIICWNILMRQLISVFIAIDQVRIVIKNFSVPPSAWTVSLILRYCSVTIESLFSIHCHLTLPIAIQCASTKRAFRKFPSGDSFSEHWCFHIIEWNLLVLSLHWIRLPHCLKTLWKGISIDIVLIIQIRLWISTYPFILVWVQDCLNILLCHFRVI